MRTLLAAGLFLCGLAVPAAAQTEPGAPPQELRVAIATDFAPFSSLEGDEGLRGRQRDMWEAWSRATGVPVRFILAPWAKIGEVVNAGLADVADPVVEHSEEAASLELSTSSTKNPVNIFFDAHLGGINDEISLRPYAVGVTEKGRCQSWLRDRGVSNLRVYPNHESLVEGALQREIHVLCMGQHAGLLQLSRAGQLERFRYTDPLYNSYIHWGVAPGNGALRDFIQSGFERIPKEERQEIQRRWSGSSPDFPWMQEWLKRSAMIGAGVAVAFLLLITWNWTLRKRVAAAVAELRAYVQRFETLVDNLPGMVIRAYQTPGGRFEVLYASRGADPAAKALSDTHLAELAENGKVMKRVQVTAPDGTVAWHDIWATVVGRRGAGIEYDSLVLDVSSEVEAKAALEHEERERRRLEVQIQEAARLEALGQLAGGIAHDFNNLLGGILGFATLVQSDIGDDHPSQKSMARISSACMRGKNLVDQILAFARQREAQTTRFSLDELVAECRPLLEVAIPSSIGIEVSPSPSSPVEIVADKGQIGQILMNLCFNARDALEDRTGTIAIGVDLLAAGAPQLKFPETPDEARAGGFRRTNADGSVTQVVGGCRPDQSYAVLSVSDSGSGMDYALLGRVFEPFFTTKTRGKGTGLGLSVVHGIVMEHGGGLIVRTRNGSGTEIKVLLPLAEPRADCEDAPAPASRSDICTSPPGLALVVDDDDDFGDAIALLLERQGWRVSRHKDPRTAQAAVTADPKGWTLLVTDQVMPHLRGQDLIAQAKAIRPDLPCLLCTGYDDGGMDEKAASAAGIDALLRKPVKLEDLQRAVAAIVTGSPPTRQPPVPAPAAGTEPPG